MDLGAEDEPGLVWVAAEVRAARQRPEAFDAAFAEATVFVQRLSDRVGVMAAELPDQGRWVLAFSTLPRLARYAGDVPWLSTSGTDLLDHLPPAHATARGSVDLTAPLCVKAILVAGL